MKYFTTLTYADQLTEKSVTDFLTATCNKWIIAHENGQGGDNHHIHIWMDTLQWSQTDTATRAFQQLYTVDFRKSLSTLRHLVETRAKRTLQAQLPYMFKDQKSVESMKYFNIDLNYLKTQFKKYGINNLSSNYVKLSLLNAPLKLNEVIPPGVPIEHEVIKHYLARLMKTEKLLTHQLIDDNQIEKIIFGVKSLRD